MLSTKTDYCIDIYGVSKYFKKATTKGSYTTLKSAILGCFRKNEVAAEDIKTAIKDLTIRIPKGASVGVIGRNGSGKSTLLKLITGIYKPSEGQIKINGRISALIELGAGFHPDFTGRENLQLGAVLHGLSKKELEERFDEIVAFAELENVIDQPVKTYSSGMFMRLGFSLAIHTNPDILLIDEVLSVGDAGFVSKCKERISELRKSGISLILVSHDLDSVERWCDEAIWLRDGEVADRGHPRRVIDHYRQYIEKGEELQLEEERDEKIAANTTDFSEPTTIEDVTQSERWGSREIEITEIKLLNESGENHLLFHTEDSMTIEISYKINELVSNLVFGIGIERNDGLQVFGSNTEIEKIKIPELNQSGKLKIKIPRLGLLSGKYLLDVAVHRDDGYPFDYHKSAVEFAVRAEFSAVGVWAPQHSWSFE